MHEVIYIAGTPYTGSTLLSMLLNAHPQLVSIGEAEGPTRRTDRGSYVCSCESPIAECAFWQRVGVEMRDRWLVPDTRLACSEDGSPSDLRLRPDAHKMSENYDSDPITHEQRLGLD